MSDATARGWAEGYAGFALVVKGHAERLGVRLVATVTTARDTSWWGGDGRVLSERVRFSASHDDADALADFLHVIGAR